MITREIEAALLDKVLLQVDERCGDWQDALKTAVLCVSPDYSSIVAMQVLHVMSRQGELPHYVSVEVAYPGDSKEIREGYKERFRRAVLPELRLGIDRVILVEAAVLTGGNYTWIVQELLGAGFSAENVVSLALLECWESVFKSEIVGDYVEGVPTFYWERYNKHWD